eukprot:8735576-Lingulodinium_polyedra.AAC.1
MDYPWALQRPPIGIDGPSVDIPCIFRGPSMDSPWSSAGHPWPWVSRGSSMHLAWGLRASSMYPSGI